MQVQDDFGEEFGDEVLGRQISGQRIEIVTDHFGADVLTGRQPGQAGRMFKRQAMFETLEEVGDILPNNARQPKS